MIQVNRDQAEVAGELSVLPDNRAVVFYPAREFAYGATVYVDLRYDGEVLSRFQYGIRPLPSFLSGLLVDQVGQPVDEVVVALPDINLRTTTGRNGAFNFGFRSNVEATLPAGRHRMVVNPGLADRRYGTTEQWVTVEPGRLNRLPAAQLPRLNPELPFQRIRGRTGNISLARDQLRLDLSGAWLQFPGGRDNGDVHVQQLDRVGIPYRAQPVANPHWMFAVQPGVRVDGEVGLSMAIPALYGSYDYIPDDGAFVLIIGFEPDEKHLIPVGLGRIEQRRIHSVGKLPLSSLAYLGYVLIPDDYQVWAERHANGEISLKALVAELER
ncbi:carboxypeptidase-like regulatory domain-containing protein [Alkalilimnicola ehrlichii]|uniref:carboxypeptidase-like regulatory domain-containing protein n=1 Tax=Alkalilimnicola ehrlichii TaxID=351052 RepID=UPI0011C05302|nr:carboxypeptidase-like regulatory domain-containing protein [Alkalilimnicola ehrlichii]